MTGMVLCHENAENAEVAVVPEQMQIAPGLQCMHVDHGRADKGMLAPTSPLA